ncbi:MAG: transcriptional repressor [Salinivirgaceae bacterium]
MKQEKTHIKKIISSHHLRATPQRIAVLEALQNLRTHPTADDIINYVKNEHPEYSVGTVYNTLETFSEKGLIKKMKTEKDVMRYDGFTDKHYHLYGKTSDRIEDYYDQELTQMIEQYFKSKKIKGFKIEDIQVQINGEFSE